MSKRTIQSPVVSISETADQFFDFEDLPDGHFAFNPFLRLGFIGKNDAVTVFNLSERHAYEMIDGNIIGALADGYANEDSCVIMRIGDSGELLSLQKREFDTFNSDPDMKIWGKRCENNMQKFGVA